MVGKHNLNLRAFNNIRDKNKSNKNHR